jgi:hypothetical protein
VATLKQKGDMAELAVALDLRRRGYGVAIPFGEAAAYDLVLDRGTSLERVQVKHARSRDGVIHVRCQSLTIVEGKVRSTTPYTAATIDWIAAWDARSGRCSYVPAAELGSGRTCMTLRLDPARNAQSKGIRWASDYEHV